MLIREPELAYNTKNKRVPRGGRNLQDDNYTNGYVSYTYGNGGPQERRKRAADEEEEEKLMLEENSEVTYHSKTHWVDHLNGYAEMTNTASPDVALFLYCMLN